MEPGSPDDLAVRVPWTRLLELTGLACWNRQRGTAGSSSLVSWSARWPKPRSRTVPATVTRFPLSWPGSASRPDLCARLLRCAPDSLSCADIVRSLSMCGDRGLPAMCPGAGGGEGFMMTAVGRAAMVMIAGAAVPVVLAGASGASAATHTLAGPGTVALAGTWRTAIEVPGTATLNTGGGAAVSSISCASAGNCSAGGAYEDSSGRGQAFVVSEVNGTWHGAIQVPGTAVTSQIGSAEVLSVSCASAGNCSAGGFYGYVENNVWRHYAFVVNEVNGTWHTAIQVPGLATLSTGLDAHVSSVSCGSAGNCSASGYYAQKSAALQAFVVNEVNGSWHTAIEVPGTATLNKDGNAWATSVSCASAGNCAAGGHYVDGSGHWQGFAASEVNGSWHTAIQVPGTATLNKGGYAGVNSVSCASAGNCTAG